MLVVVSFGDKGRVGWWRRGVAAGVVCGGCGENGGGGAWYSGSVRSGEEEYLWCWPENSPENYSGGGVVAVARIRRWLPEVEGEGERAL
ncbi:hypothetical protein Tco_0685745, partial [Tanacetum coccineum]